jgi:tetratricopeptide (TPR) repeat protein
MSISGKSNASIVRTDVPVLEQTAGAGWGRTFELSREKLSIGRTTDNEIVLDSTSVSRVHAVLKKTPRGWFIEDNISKNGIWVNGIAIKKALLRPNDVIQIGEFVFRYVDPKVAPVARPEDSVDRNLASSKTEIIGTDTWNIGGESPPQKPPLEQKPAPTEAVAKVEAEAEARDAGAAIADSPDEAPMDTAPIERPPADSAQGASQVPYIPPRARPDSRPPEPIRLATFAKDNHEKLYLLMGLVGGLLVGSLLYMRLNKQPQLLTPVAVDGTKASQTGKAIAPQDAFRQIAETADALEVSEEKADEPVAKTKASQALTKAAEEAKRPSVRAEELQFGGKRKQRAASKDIAVYIAEGKSYLRDGDFKSAVLAFRFALVIDSTNAEARAGLSAAQNRKKVITVDDTVTRTARESKPKPKPEPKVDKHAEKRATVGKLLRSAVDLLKKRRYQDAISTAEKVRQIEIPGETAYLNEAKQIIDRGERRQKEEFEPFIELAKQKLVQGDYRGSILLCEEMLRTDPGYAPAKECMERSTAGLAASITQPTAPKSEGVK